VVLAGACEIVQHSGRQAARPSGPTRSIKSKGKGNDSSSNQAAKKQRTRHFFAL
jgi:hypothetical protein